MKRNVTLYPKTRRLGAINPKVVITEKIDGSNLAIFEWEGEIYIAQRNWIFALSDLENYKKAVYRGLFAWIEDKEEFIRETLQSTACICGEWIGMGTLQYPLSYGRFVQFAKANVHMDNGEFALKNIYYDRDLFKWSWKTQEIPEFIIPVPVVHEVDFMPAKEYLDELYDAYTQLVDRRVEGFVVIANNQPVKYVRMKNGSLTPHKS